LRTFRTAKSEVAQMLPQVAWALPNWRSYVHTMTRTLVQWV